MATNAPFAKLASIPRDVIQSISDIILGKPGGVDDLRTFRTLGANSVPRLSMMERAKRLAATIRQTLVHTDRSFPFVHITLLGNRSDILQTGVSFGGREIRIWLHVDRQHIQLTVGPIGVPFSDFVYQSDTGWTKNFGLVNYDFQTIPTPLMDIILAMLIKYKTRTGEYADLLSGAIARFESGIQSISDVAPVDWSDSGMPRNVAAGQRRIQKAKKLLTNTSTAPGLSGVTGTRGPGRRV